MGVIPIYYGASNNSDFIPRDIPKSKNDFKNYDDLYHHLINLSEERYLIIIKKIKDYFASDQVKIFTDQYNVELISSRISTFIEVNKNE